MRSDVDVRTYVRISRLHVNCLCYAGLAYKSPTDKGRSRNISRLIFFDMELLVLSPPSMTSNVSNFQNSDIKNAVAPSSYPSALTANAAAPLSAITTTNTMIPLKNATDLEGVPELKNVPCPSMMGIS